jgi:hypothetical protein
LLLFGPLINRPPPKFGDTYTSPYEKVAQV